MERAEYLLYQALDDDEAGNTEDALELYMQAVELCLQAVKTLIEICCFAVAVDKLM